jgi:RND family efflux transporter MFP subunit
VPLQLRAQIAAAQVAATPINAQATATEPAHTITEAPPRKRRGRWLLLAAVLLVGAGFAGQHAWRTRAAPAPVASVAAKPAVLELAPRETVKAARADLRHSIRLSGTTQAADQVVVRSQLPAKVAAVTVREGDAVEKGKTIAILDTAEVKAQLDQRLAALTSSEAQLMRAERDRTAKLELAQKGWVAQATVDRWRAPTATPRARWPPARPWWRWRARRCPTPRSRRRSAGIIGKRIVDAGGVVAVGGEVATILDLSRLEIAAAVPANEIARVKTGQPVTMRTGLNAMALRGEVIRINPATEPGSQSIIVHVGLPNADGGLPRGVFVSGAVIVTETKGALTVPSEAMRQDDRGTYVLAVEDGHLVRRAVMAGLVSDAQELTEIRNGLQDGDRVVVGPAMLKAGQSVRVADAEPTR